MVNKKIIIEIDLTGELIEIITKQIENIIENSLGIHKNKSHEKIKKINVDEIVNKFVSGEKNKIEADCQSQKNYLEIQEKNQKKI